LWWSEIIQFPKNCRRVTVLFGSGVGWEERARREPSLLPLWVYYNTPYFVTVSRKEACES
jgi:hypothetical protein